MLMFLAQKLANAVLVAGGAGVGAVQTAVGAEPAGRALTAAETVELTKIFADALDYNLIRLKIGNCGVFAVGGAPFTHCNTIYVPDGYLPAETAENYNAAFWQLLAHEAHHVWQYQHGGANYMSASLWHQFAGWRATGTRGAAYDFERGIAEGKTWEQLNPEQQARLVETAYVSGLFDDEHQQFVYNNSDYTVYAREAISQLRRGAGAP